ncbi:MAG: hypothetical protein ABEJ04_03835 [Halobacteriaceae archaeon]
MSATNVQLFGLALLVLGGFLYVGEGVAGLPAYWLMVGGVVVVAAGAVGAGRPCDPEASADPGPGPGDD